MSLLDQYNSKLLESLIAQEREDLAREDELLAELDVVWRQMSAEQRASALETVRKVGRGEMTLNELAQTTRKNVIASWFEVKTISNPMSSWAEAVTAHAPRSLCSMLIVSKPVSLRGLSPRLNAVGTYEQRTLSAA